MMTDLFSKWVEAFSLKSTDSKDNKYLQINETNLLVLFLNIKLLIILIVSDF